MARRPPDRETPGLSMSEDVCERPVREAPPPCGEGLGWGAESRSDRRVLIALSLMPSILLTIARRHHPHPFPTRGKGGVQAINLCPQPSSSRRIGASSVSSSGSPGIT